MIRGDRTTKQYADSGQGQEGSGPGRTKGWGGGHGGKADRMEQLGVGARAGNGKLVWIEDISRLGSNVMRPGERTPDG
jgi:hypothetical protein